MIEVKIAAQQPNFLPDFNYFYKTFCSDIFFIADFLRFRKQSPIVRANFSDFYLTVPVKHHKINPHPPLSNVKMVDQKLWRQNHLRSLKSRYSSLPFFEHYFPELENIYNRQVDSLNAFLWDLFSWHLKMLFPSKLVYRCSDEDIHNLRDLKDWIQQYQKISWIIYPQEQSYYRDHFPGIPCRVLSFKRNSLLPFPYAPDMPLLLLLFLKGPETGSLFQ
ncbi:MAG: WbqC family protein [bacterium]|nr:MAG: WbqC family protein [bacterium]